MGNDRTFANTKATSNGNTRVVARFDVELPIQFHSVGACIDRIIVATQDSGVWFLHVAVFATTLGTAGQLGCVPDLVCCVGSCTGGHRLVGTECCRCDSGGKWQRTRPRQQRRR